MDYRYLGRSALKVSPLCLSTMMFGGETEEATAARIINKAFDAGVNFIDTADIYHAGRSEMNDNPHNPGVRRKLCGQVSRVQLLDLVNTLPVEFGSIRYGPRIKILMLRVLW